jgi:phage terminase small subunit
MRAKPAADPARSDSPLTITEEAFVTEYLRNGENGTAAWMFTHPGTLPGYACLAAHRLIRKDKVKARIESERNRLAAKAEIDREGLLQELLAIVRADPNELTQMRLAACSACYASSGGRGNAMYVEPDPECETCAGDGVAVPWFADTRKLSPQARALFAGVKTTKDGAQVLVHDKMGAIDRIARIIGAYKEDNDQKTKPIADAVRDFFGQLHGTRLPIKKDAPQQRAQAGPGHPLVGAK